ncbi:MAG TPA: Y-family DNA polymerase [Methylophilaceae bacterium]|nr:Y-family DNA polymerase [Methylophilaceae bacterium]
MQSSLLSKQIFGLADANSFYVSCEYVFRPDLWGQPGVVLSNNDGCGIAYNAQAKAILGLRMAQAWFEVEEMARKIGVNVFSSNYTLYAQMSLDFMETLSTFLPVEVYSVDEAFLDATGIIRDLTDLGREIKETVAKWVKLPICVGWGHTKTMAKLANHIAKKQPVFNGVCDLTAMSEVEVDTILENLDVKKIWGVGEQLKEKLNAVGVYNVLRLKRADPKRIRDKFGVILERTVRELNNETWLGLEDMLPEAKQVRSSRSFGARVESLDDLVEVITYHSTMAAERMRSKGLFAQGVHVDMQNSPFDQAEYFHGSKLVYLPAPTNSTRKITEAALWLLEKAYRPGIYYQKAGVMLLDLVPEAGQQKDLLGYTDKDETELVLMKTMDEINKRWGRGTLKLGSEGIDKSWAMRRNYKSPDYLSNMKELPVAYAD